MRRNRVRLVIRPHETSDTRGVHRLRPLRLEARGLLDGDRQKQCDGPRRRGLVREPVVGQRARSSLRPGGRQDVRGRDRQGPVESDPGVGRARRRAQGGAVHGGDGHGQPQSGLGRGVPAHQHPAVQHPERGEPLQARGTIIGARTTPRSLVRRRRWTGSSPTTSARSPRRWAVNPPTRSTRRS